MERAVYSKTSKLITVAEYIQLEGTRLNSLGQPQRRALVTCPGCEEPVHTVGEGSTSRANTWAHDPNPSGPWCPIKDASGTKYALLTPRKPDVAQGKALRSAFLANWKIHWGHIQEMAHVADVHTLVGFIHEADSTKFWEHAGLQEWHIPYVFLASCEFPPRANRGEWLRFMFDGKVRTFEDLWIRTTGVWRFLRMRYRRPRSGSPGPSNYIDCELLSPDPGFLARTFYPPNSYQLGVMLKEFGV